MNKELQREVLKTFKILHRTRTRTFNGDPFALDFVQKKINDEFKKYKHVTDEGSIKELIKYGQDVEREIRMCIVQAVEKEPGLFQLNITKDHLIDNTPPPGTPLPKYEKGCSSSKKTKN